MGNRAQCFLILACVVGAVGFVGFQLFRAAGTRNYDRTATFHERAQLAEFASNGVAVNVSLEIDSAGRPLLRARFEPTADGFHLYSKDLNPEDVDGIGIPTTLELVENSSVTAAGALFADVTPKVVEMVSLNLAFPIYPDGPVTLRLPVQYAASQDPTAAQIAVSYMACTTDGVCLEPVKRHLVNVSLSPKGMP